MCSDQNKERSDLRFKRNKGRDALRAGPNQSRLPTNKKERPEELYFQKRELQRKAYANVTQGGQVLPQIGSQLGGFLLAALILQL